ncbi:MAG TPA: Grx4 family monothiol glutaredoxin [Steroidobacteraceae bacterium]
MERPLSPCIKVCVLGPGDRCVGCLRTLDEITAWGSMSAAAQWALVQALADRRREVAEDVVNRIKTHISTSPAVLFMKGTPDFPQCGFSAQAVAALRAAGVNSFHAVNIFEDPELREALKQFSNWPTYPQLYVKGELVGGCDIVLDMHRSGELKKLLAEAGAA